MRRILVGLGAVVAASSFVSIAEASDPPAGGSAPAPTQPSGVEVSAGGAAPTSGAASTSGAAPTSGAATATTPAPATTTGAAEEPKDKAEEKKEGEEEEPKWEVNLDFVGGAATTETLYAGSPTLREVPPQDQLDSTRLTVFSIVVGLERKLTERFTIGARLPVEQAYLESREGLGLNRDYLIAGNLELEGAFKLFENKHVELEASLGVALPTQGGAELPSRDEVLDDPAKVYEYRRIDRGAVGQAASETRGGYESALFEAGRLGLVPRVAAAFKAGDLTIRPTIKVENLIDVTGDATHTYIGELIGGVRASYRVLKWLEPGAHVWAEETFTPSEESNTVLGVVEPFLRFPLGAVTPHVGAILPFSGHLVDDNVFGIRVAFAGEF